MKNISLFFFLVLNISLSAQNLGVKLPVATLPNTTLDVNGSMAFREGLAINLTNPINNDVPLGDFSFFRITGATTPFSITGFTNGVNGRVLNLINATSQILTLTHQATSLANNQLNTGGTSISLSANGVAIFIYNSTLARWILTGGQGFKYNWTLSGNAGTTAGTHFLGTTDAQPLVINANTEGVRLLASGNLGIGTQTAQNKLDIEGSAVIGTTFSGTTVAPTNGLLVEGNAGLAANLKIGTSSSTIDASSALEIQSTTKSFVPPRMTTAQMNAIASPLVGSIVFNTTLNCLHQFKATSGWTSFCNTTTRFTYEALQTSILSQSFGSSFADIPGVSGLSISIPRTGTYTIIARAYFASEGTNSSDNSGAQGSFKLVVDGTSYEESYLTSLGIYNFDDDYTLWGLGTQGMIVKTLFLTVGSHTISLQGRTWSGTNCNSGSWGIETSGYVNSGGSDVAWSKLTLVEN
jgi:hypothetical protein